MELLLKVGGSQDPRHWRDGQIIDIRPDGFHKEGTLQRKHHCVLTLPGDYWQLRGSTNWKWSGQKVYDNIKKYLVAVDSQGKYPWEQTMLLDEKRLRRRDWFFDFKLLLDLGLITPSQFDAIYDKKKDPGTIFIERAFDQIVRNEYSHQRLSSKYSLARGSVSSGTFSIGAALNYATVTAFEADIIIPGDGPLTGNLTGEHANEETVISTGIVFDVDTAGYLLKLTAASGAEHNGGAYGNGARVNFGTYDYLKLDETTDGHLDDAEISNLAFDISGVNDYGLLSYDGDDENAPGCGTTQITTAANNNNISSGANKRGFRINLVDKEFPDGESKLSLSWSGSYSKFYLRWYMRESYVWTNTSYQKLFRIPDSSQKFIPEWKSGGQFAIAVSPFGGNEGVDHVTWTNFEMGDELSLDTWYCYEIMFDIPNKTFELWINGVSKGQKTASGIDTGWTVGGMEIGGNQHTAADNPASTETRDYDNVVVSESYIGPVS
ncbi:hypothetical protein KKC06_06820 [Patescibacteria group bacterium]|nr:hypothetical protein [Patescibacteria group bacterium]